MTTLATGPGRIFHARIISKRRPMQSFTFTSERLTKSALIDVEDRSVRYTTSTVKQGFARQRTTLENSSGIACATIDWRERTFEIRGKKENIDLLKRKVSNFSLCVSWCCVPWRGLTCAFNRSTRYWKWADGEEYKAKYSNSANMWIVRLLFVGLIFWAPIGVVF